MKFIIGEEIKKIVKNRGIKNKAFADQMNMEERNLYHFFKKDNLELDLILLASKVLDYDFLNLYIDNSKYKDFHKKKSPDSSVLTESNELLNENTENQISFSFTIKGSIESFSNNMSIFLQSLKKEASANGFKVQ